MNLKLIEKLARLANNNPNEHEANLAARKVCRLLEESNFEFVNEQPGTWEDVKRTSEPDWRDIFNRGSWAQYYNPFEDYEPFGRPRKPYPGDSQKPKEKRKNQKRKCVECGSEMYTFNLSEPFICRVCQYEMGKKTT